MKSRALILVPTTPLPARQSRSVTLINYHADYLKACKSYKAANELGVRPALQRLKLMMMLTETIEEFLK